MDIKIKKLCNYFAFIWLVLFGFNPIESSAIRINQNELMGIAAYYESPRKLDFTLLPRNNNDIVAFGINNKNNPSNVISMAHRASEIYHNTSEKFYYKVISANGPIAYPMVYSYDKDANYKYIINKHNGFIITRNLVADVLFSIMCNDWNVNELKTKITKIRISLGGQHYNMANAINGAVANFSETLYTPSPVGGFSKILHPFRSSNDMNYQKFSEKLDEFFYTLLCHMAGKPNGKEFEQMDPNTAQAKYLCNFWSDPKNVAICEFWDALCFLISRVCENNFVISNVARNKALIEYNLSTIKWIISCVNMILQDNEPTEEEELILKMKRCAKQWSNCCYLLYQNYTTMAKIKEVKNLLAFGRLDQARKLFDGRMIQDKIDNLISGRPLIPDEINALYNFINAANKNECLFQLSQSVDVSYIDLNRSNMTQGQLVKNILSSIKHICNSMEEYAKNFSMAWSRLKGIKKNIAVPYATAPVGKVGLTPQKSWNVGRDFVDIEKDSNAKVPSAINPKIDHKTDPRKTLRVMSQQNVGNKPVYSSAASVMLPHQATAPNQSNLFSSSHSSSRSILDKQQSRRFSRYGRLSKTMKPSWLKKSTSGKNRKINSRKGDKRHKKTTLSKTLSEKDIRKLNKSINRSQLIHR
ncbi:MAG: hypothetical protein LBH49_00610 [Puniceicoccales bacterium]|jgi:hypothetical protein|nr:hypothetical protein [Puniceicoccales bacterium]